MKQKLLTFLLALVGVAAAWGAQPDKCLDECTGGEGLIHVQGWAYDPDASAQSINVHVYVYTDESCTSQYGSVHVLMANVPRPDVNAARGITGNHGFSADIPIADAGNYWVKLFAIDTGGDGNPQIGATTAVTVTATTTPTTNGQTLLNGDLNHNGVIDIADVTALVNVVLGKSQAEVIDVYAVNNTAVVGTWYKSDGTSFAFRQDGTTTYPGGATYEYMYLLRWLQVYNSSGTLVKTLKLREVTAQYLLEETDNGTTIRYTNSAYMVSGITLSQTSLALNSGSTGQLTATVSPSNALEKGVTWSSSNASVAYVDQSGLVTAVSGGTCTITATAKDGSGVSATCTVTVTGGTDSHAYVDLGLPSGTLWATCNIGANNPEDYGDYFAWGETEGYNNGKTTFDWSTYMYCNGSYNSLTKYCTSSSYGTWDNRTELELSDDAAYVNWGADWRMPSDDQFTELINSSYTTTEWTTVNGVYGRKITSKSNGNSLFLPAVGYRNGSSLNYGGSYGFYWSRTLDMSRTSYAYGLYSESSDIGTNIYDRYSGRSVRPVRKQ